MLQDGHLSPLSLDWPPVGKDTDKEPHGLDLPPVEYADCCGWLDDERRKPHLIIDGAAHAIIWAMLGYTAAHHSEVGGLVIGTARMKGKSLVAANASDIRIVKQVASAGSVVFDSAEIAKQERELGDTLLGTIHTHLGATSPSTIDYAHLGPIGKGLMIIIANQAHSLGVQLGFYFRTRLPCKKWRWEEGIVAVDGLPTDVIEKPKPPEVAKGTSWSHYRQTRFDNIPETRLAGGDEADRWRHLFSNEGIE